MIAKCISIERTHPARQLSALAGHFALMRYMQFALRLSTANNNTRTHTLAVNNGGKWICERTTHNGERNHIKSEQIGEGNLVGCKPEIMRCDSTCARSFILCERLLFCAAHGIQIIKNALEFDALYMRGFDQQIVI